MGMAGYKTIENRDRQVWLIDIHIKKNGDVILQAFCSGYHGSRIDDGSDG